MRDRIAHGGVTKLETLLDRVRCESRNQILRRSFPCPSPFLAATHVVHSLLPSTPSSIPSLWRSWVFPSIPIASRLCLFHTGSCSRPFISPSSLLFSPHNGHELRRVLVSHLRQADHAKALHRRHRSTTPRTTSPPRSSHPRFS
jgi:hypothetical protein